MMRSEVENLFSRAAIGLDEEGQKAEGPIGWHAITLLRQIPDRIVLNAALACCLDADAIRRRIGAAVLGQLGHANIGAKPVFTEERYLGLVGLLNAECQGAGNTDVLGDACIGLGHLRDSRAIPALLSLKDHPDAGVRLGVVHGLSGDETPDAISGLIALSSDIDEEVRDWATFSLANQASADTPAIRAALQARLDDLSVEVRNEAIEGLAKRGEQSVLPFLVRELRTGMSLPLLNAAIALARPKLCDVLVAASRDGVSVETPLGNYDLANVWAEAMQSCGCHLPGCS